MKKLYLTILIILTALLSNAQKTELTDGAKLGKVTSFFEKGRIGNDADNVYYLTYNNLKPLGSWEGLKIEKYSFSTTLLVFETNLQPKTIDGVESVYNRSFLAGDFIYIISTTFNKEINKYSLYLEKLNRKTGESISDPELIYSTIVKNENSKGRFTSQFNPNIHKMMFCYTPSGETDTFFYEIRDQSAKVIWSNNLKFPYTNEKFELINREVDDMGNIYILLRKEEKERKKNKHAKRYDLLTYDAVTKVLQQKELNLANEYLTVPFLELEEEKIVIGGYCCSFSSEDLAGAFFTKLGKKEKNVLSSSYVDFPEEITKKPKTPGEINFLDQLGDFHFIGSHLKKDGGYYFMAEQFLKGELNYHYDEILVANVDVSGNITWIKKVPKRTEMSVHSLITTVWFTVNDNLVFLYNDFRRNIIPDSVELTKKEAKRLMTEQIVVMAAVDASGVVEKKELIRYEDSYLIIPFLSCKINPTEVWLYGILYKDYTYRSTKLKFK
ncbi:MAG: hypothetical protein Q8M29_12375 [Bacteroidota bacterium]|nr:hypothetical protein [Bacteroidota bacterium]